VTLKKTAFVIAITLVLIVLYYQSRQPKPVKVDSALVEKGVVKATVANTRVGTVKACRRAYLAPATGGKVAKLSVHEGDKVKQHQLLLEVWNEDLKAQLELQQAQIRVDQNSAEQACQLGDVAKREASRFSRLQKFNHIVSEQQVDTKITDAKAQGAACRAAQAAVEVGRASLTMAQAAVQRTLLHAPFDGTVAEINVELGEFVTPSPPGIPTLPAIDLMDVSCLLVSAPIDEVDAPQVKLGMAACIALDAFKDKRCSGKVTRIAPYVLEKEKQARTLEIEAVLTDPAELAGLLPGYSADIEIVLAEKTAVLKIPTEAVFDAHTVLLVNRDNILEKRNFTAGLANWNSVEVVSGLREGDRVVTSIGEDGVVPGASVIVSE
jgi:HlyD family secretion protein